VLFRAVYFAMYVLRYRVEHFFGLRRGSSLYNIGNEHGRLQYRIISHTYVFRVRRLSDVSEHLLKIFMVVFQDALSGVGQSSGSKRDRFVFG
jgi:hypothetical protein